MKHSLLIFFVFILIACNNNSKKDAEENKQSITALAGDSSKAINSNSDTLVLASSRQVLGFLKNKAFIQLAGLFHP